MSEADIALTLQKYDLKARGATPTSRAIVPKTFQGAALQHLRWYLIQTKRLPKEYVNQKFCDKDGADVPDDTSFDVYIKLNKESEADSFNVYVIAPGEQQSIWTGMDADTTAFLKEGLDLKPSQQMAFLNPSLNKLTSSVKRDEWKASAGKADTHAADMDERQWGIVMRNNDLLNGKFFEGGSTNSRIAVPTSIGRARYTAFALKERAIPDYNVTFQVPKDIPGITKKPEITFRIPRFQICDSSRVEVFETKSSLADSMASNAFSQTTVEAAAGGGAFGVSVGVKAGATTSDSSSFAESSSRDESRMHVVYLFPRVEVFLDVEDLELTEECQSYLKKLREPTAKKEDADIFFQKFGHVFVPRVQLGGRLHSVESTSSIAGANTKEKSSALKAAASASVSGFGFQASVSASHETTSNSKTEKSYSSSNHSITWHADGGDTLLCNNPPAWCPTVHSFYNWRVMNQIGMVDIVQLIGKMKGWEDIPRRFQHIYFANVQFKLLKCEDDHEAPPYLGMVGNEEVLERPEAGGGNFSRRAKRHVLSKSHSREEHMASSLQVLALKNQMVWEGPKGEIPRFKYGTKYPMRFCVRDKESQELSFYAVRRTTQTEHYQNENVLYAGLNEEPNVLVQFLKIQEHKTIDGVSHTVDWLASSGARRIGSHDTVRMDVFDNETKERLGWLQNQGGIAKVNPRTEGQMYASIFKFMYV
ncbi:hypothetical protein BDV40DRAFT_299511 [Aspergillus tamarii]|uniref:MACPF-like domain-containing protein n=1 Tax=Aspergillus tamarii TaxID=41984 RepID=A0A5N6V001_ASPTM|nr:hypothetical protein BDV40DRAFT_299511 [Aspergillus tamarii]